MNTANSFRSPSPRRRSDSWSFAAGVAPDFVRRSARVSQCAVRSCRSARGFGRAPAFIGHRAPACLALLLAATALLLVAPRHAVATPDELEMGRVYRLAVLIDNNVLDLIDAVSSPYLDEEDLPRDLRDLSESSYEFVQEVREKADSPGQTNGEYRALVRDFEDAHDELRDLRLGRRTDRILDRLSGLIAELGFYYGDRISPSPHDRPDRPDWDDDRSPDGVIESARRIERLTRLAYLQAYQEMQRGRPISSDAEELVETLLSLREAGRDFYAEVRANRGNVASSSEEFNDVVRYHAVALRRADRSNSSLRGTLQSIGHEIDELRRLDRGRGEDRRGDDPYDRPGYIPIDRMPWAEPRTSPRSDFDDRDDRDDDRWGDDHRQGGDYERRGDADGRDEDDRRGGDDDDRGDDDDDDRDDDNRRGLMRFESRDDPRPTIRLQRSN